MEKSELVEMARMAEQMERYDDMASYMRQAVERGENLDMGERNLLSVAYKNKVGSLRSAWRAVYGVEQRKDYAKPENAKAYRQELEEELRGVAREVLRLLDDHLLKENEDTESQVFFLKMKGDYYRYVAEVTSVDHDRDNTKRLSQSAYSEALSASKKMAATHPIRLGLVLNFSVFYYEILNKPEEAQNLAQEAFNDAIAELDEKDPSFKDSTLIMQLLRDNIMLWNSEDEAKDGDVPGE